MVACALGGVCFLALAVVRPALPIFTQQEREAVGRAAAAGLKLRFELANVADRLAGTLTVTNKSDDPDLWLDCLSHAYGTGCVYFTEGGDYQGYLVGSPPG